MINLEKILREMDIKESTWIGLTEIFEKGLHFMVRNEIPEKMIRTIDHGLMAQVMVDGHFAYAATDNLSEDSIKETVNKAHKLACASSELKLFPFTLNTRKAFQGEFVTPYSQGIDSLSMRGIYDFLISVSQQMKINDKIKQRYGYIYFNDKTINFTSSNGGRGLQHIVGIMTHLEVLARLGNEIQRRSSEYECRQTGLEFLDNHQFSNKANQLAEEALILLEASECPNEKLDLVLTPDQLHLQLHESIGHPLELDRILGDERNYAGFSFVKESDFGRLQYGSPLLNVTFDPMHPEAFASYLFDDTGNLATKEHLIKDGLLVRGIGGRESQERSSIPGVSCSRSSNWNRPPIDRMANINIEPGHSTLSEIISMVENGILMKTNRSWSIDDYRRKFQFGSELGQIIKDGELKGIVKNPNYRGITTPFWNSLKALGNEETVELRGSPYCGKGEPNQGINVAHAVPVALFENVEVFGGNV